MICENMLIKNLDFGNIEGKNEFDITSPENKEKVKDTFFINNESVFQEFIEGQKYYIYGHKGTGKTSFLKYVELLCLEDNYKTQSISFKDVKYDTALYSMFQNLLRNVSDKNSAAITFWKWFLLSVIIEEYNLPANDKDLIFYTENNLFKELSRVFVQIIKGIKFTKKFDDSSSNLEISLDQLKINELSDIHNAGQKIKSLTKIIQTNLQDKIFIFIDELETSKISTTYEEDAILIKNLILTVNYLNDISKNILFITAIRTEVLRNIFMSGDEVNKLLEGRGYEIKWEFDSFSINHPLIQMIIKKMLYSMKIYAQKNKITIENSIDNTIIFSRWFPENFFSKEDGNIPMYILNNTWARPRDIIRLMNTLRDKALGEKTFLRKHYDATIKDYSERAWGEIKEELVSVLEQSSIESIESVFSNFDKHFTYQMLIDRFIEKSSLRQEDTIKKVIDTLYRMGIIGNREYVETTKKTIFRYAHRGDRYLDETLIIEVHRGLWRTFSSRDSAIIYKDKDKDKDKKLPNQSQKLYNNQEEQLEIYRKLGIKI